MKIRDIVQREFDAINRDLEWERGWKGKLGRDFDECMEHWQQYPSILSRFRTFYGSIYRGKKNVVEFPYKVKSFIHRGRYGWATPDTSSMDYTLAKHIDGMFREFVKVSSDIVDYEQDNTDKIALEIADGFRAYHEYVDSEWRMFVDEELLPERIQLQDEEYERVRTKLKHSCELLGEHYPALWW